MMTPSIAIGGLMHAVEIGREKLDTSKPYGIARINRALSRVRWADAYQRLRTIRLIRDASTDEIIENGDAGVPASLESEGRIGLDTISVVHGAANAARLRIDGAGSSSYRGGDALPRVVADLSMIATHILGYDYDVLMERNARWVLGLGLGPEDATIRL